MCLWNENTVTTKQEHEKEYCMEKVLPTLLEFKTEAKDLKKQDASIKNFFQALDKKAKHYGHEDWQSIRPIISLSEPERMAIPVIGWNNPLRNIASDGEDVPAIAPKDINSRTLEMYNSIDWSDIKHTKVVSQGFSQENGAIALLSIRGKDYKLFDCDYYLLLAVVLTDGFDVDHECVSRLKMSIGEDINHFSGSLMDILFGYSSYNLEALEVFNEFYDDYNRDAHREPFDITVYVYKLIVVLGEVNKG